MMYKNNLLQVLILFILFSISCKRENILLNVDSPIKKYSLEDYSFNKPVTIKNNATLKESIKEFLKMLKEKKPANYESIIHILDNSNFDEKNKQILKQHLVYLKNNFDITRGLIQQGVSKDEISTEFKRTQGISVIGLDIERKSAENQSTCDQNYQNAINSCNYSYAIAKFLNLAGIANPMSFVGYVIDEFKALYDLFDCLDSASINHTICSGMLIA